MEDGIKQTVPINIQELLLDRLIQRVWYMITFLIILLAASIILLTTRLASQLERKEVSIPSLKVDIGIFFFNTLLILFIIFLQNWTFDKGSIILLIWANLIQLNTMAYYSQKTIK